MKKLKIKEIGITVREKWGELEEAAKTAVKNLYTFDDFTRMEDGMGTVEVILIIVVLIGLVLIFKKQIRSVVEKIMDKISSDSDSVMS